MEKAWVRPYDLGVLLKARAELPEPLQGPFFDGVAHAEAAMSQGAKLADVMAQFDADMTMVREQNGSSVTQEKMLGVLRAGLSDFLGRWY